LILQGVSDDSRWRLLLQLSLAPIVPELMDLWGEYAFHPRVRLRLGQYKVPLTRFRQQSFARQVLVDWAAATNVFGAERQVGAMLHDGLGYEAGLSYAVGVFTGINARASFETGMARAYGEPMDNPSDLRGPAPVDRFQPEIVMQLAHSAPGIDARTTSDARRTPWRHSVGLSVAWDIDPAPQDFALRLAPELLVKHRGLGFNLVGYLGLFDKAGGTVGLGVAGITAELCWRLLPRWEIATRYSRSHWLVDLRRAARQRADRLIAAAPAGDEREALAAQHATTGLLLGEHELALGLNVYLVGHSLKWQSDLAWLRSEQTTPDDRDALRFRTQLQLAF
jgi:hypothetical protein